MAHTNYTAPLTYREQLALYTARQAINGDMEAIDAWLTEGSQLLGSVEDAQARIQARARGELIESTLTPREFAIVQAVDDCIHALATWGEIDRLIVEA